MRLLVTFVSGFKYKTVVWLNGKSVLYNQRQYINVMENLLHFSIFVSRASPDADSPARAEYVHGLGEDVVVDDARVYAEYGHEEDDVASAEEYLPDLVALELVVQLLLTQHHEQGEEEHDDAVTGVAEHDGEQERKRDDGERRRIELAVAGYAVRVHDVLKAGAELVHAIVRGRHLLGLHAIENGLYVAAAHLGALVERQLDARELVDGCPALGYEALLVDLEIEQVHRVIDGLHLAHAAKPRAQVLRRVLQQVLAQVERLVEHCLELLESGHHAKAHLASLVRHLRTRIDSRLEASTHTHTQNNCNHKQKIQ